MEYGDVGPWQTPRFLSGMSITKSIWDYELLVIDASIIKNCLRKKKSSYELFLITWCVFVYRFDFDMVHAPERTGTATDSSLCQDLLQDTVGDNYFYFRGWFLNIVQKISLRCCRHFLTNHNYFWYGIVEHWRNILLLIFTIKKPRCPFYWPDFFYSL